MFINLILSKSSILKVKSNNLFRLINQTISLFSIEKDDLSDLSPLEIIDIIDELVVELKKKIWKQ